MKKELIWNCGLLLFGLFLVLVISEGDDELIMGLNKIEKENLEKKYSLTLIKPTK